LGTYIYAAIMNKPESQRPTQTPIRKVEGGGNIVLTEYPKLARRSSVDIGTVLFAEENEQFPAGNLDEETWEHLMFLIEEKRCTPLIGDRTCYGSILPPHEIAKKWAELYRYPFEDSYNLSKVAQFIALDRFFMFPKKEISKLIADATAPDFFESDEPHGVLADLNLPVYITTNYDDFMSQALKSRGKRPVEDFPRWNASPFKDESNNRDSDLFELTKQEPIVYNLFGHIKVPTSIVLTEEDRNQFLASFSNHVKNIIDRKIRMAMATTALLLVGYTIDDWKLITLLNMLNMIHGISNLGYPIILVHPFPRSEHQREQQIAYVSKYFAKYDQIVHIYWGSVRQFMRELSSRWQSNNK
jgi:hypothetical protein